MPRYAAFLRGVSPMNAKMPELRRAFEVSGYENVVTVQSSGNVVFDADTEPLRQLERKAEAGMQKHLGHSFVTIVRPVKTLQQLIRSDPFDEFTLPKNSNRIVTFLRGRPANRLRLPIEKLGTQILAMKGGMIFSAYVPSASGAAFMTVIEKAFGKEITTRTWQTIERVSKK